MPEETADNKGEEADDNKTEDTTLVFWSIGLKLKDDSGIKMPEELAANRFIAKFEEDHPGVTIEVIDQSTIYLKRLTYRRKDRT